MRILKGGRRAWIRCDISLETQQQQVVHRAVSRSLVHTASLQRLQGLINTHRTSLNPCNVTTALVKLSTLAKSCVTPEDRTAIEDLTNALLQQLESSHLNLSAPQIAQVAQSLVRLPVSSPPAWLPHALSAHQQGLYACDDVELCQLLWALVKLDVPAPSQEWVCQAAAVGGGRLHDFNPLQLSMFGWALAKLGYQPGDVWLSEYSSAARHWVREDHTPHDPDHVALMVWTLATWQYTLPADWLLDLYRYCDHHWHRLKWLSLIHLMKSLGRMRVQPPAPWLHNCCVCGRQFFNTSTPSTDLQFLCALAHFNHKVDPFIMADLLHHMQPRLCVYTPSQLGELMWALTRLRYVPSQQYVEVLLEQVGSCLSALPPSGVCSLLVVLKQWQLLPTQQYMMGVLQYTSRSLPRFTSHQLVTMAVHFRQLGVTVPLVWVRKLLEEVVRRADDMQPSQVAAVVFALHRLLSQKDLGALRQQSALLDRTSAAATKVLSECTPHDVVLLVLGFVRVGYWPGHRFVEVAAVCAANMEAASDQPETPQLHEALKQLDDLQKL